MKVSKEDERGLLHRCLWSAARRSDVWIKVINGKIKIKEEERLAKKTKEYYYTGVYGPPHEEAMFGLRWSMEKEIILKTYIHLRWLTCNCDMNDVRERSEC